VLSVSVDSHPSYRPMLSQQAFLMPDPKPPRQPATHASRFVNRPVRHVSHNASISGRAISASKGFPAPKALNHHNPNKVCPSSPRGLANPPEAAHLDAWLDAAQLPQGQPIAALVNEIARSLPKVRVDAAQRQLKVITNVIANFTASASIITTNRPAIAVPLRREKSTRYDRPEITGKQLKPVIDALEAMGLIDRQPAIFKQRRTVIAPTARLIELIAAHQVTAASLTRLPNEEVIILRQRHARYNSANIIGDDGDGETFTLALQDRTPLDYPDDCPEANALRTELRRYNEFLSKSDIRVVGIDNPPPFKPFRRLFDTSGPIQFNLHGRIYSGQVGGWHQNLAKDQRHLVRINGEKIVEVDWQSLHLHLAYVEAQCSPPAGDLYAVHPELEAHRSGVKVAVSAMLSISGELLKLPQSVREASPTLPKQWTARRIAAAVKAHHPAISHLFGKDRGIAYMHKDSTLLMKVLTRLMERGLPSAALHDAILVQQSARDVAIATMLEASMELLGVELPVSVKGYVRGR
jgi:hypothetical protein